MLVTTRAAANDRTNVMIYSTITGIKIFEYIRPIILKGQQNLTHLWSSVATASFVSSTVFPEAEGRYVTKQVVRYSTIWTNWVIKYPSSGAL